MDRMVTTSAQRTAASRPRPRLYYRLLHSTGELFIRDRAEAIARLASLPGAKLFLLHASAE